MDRSINDGTNYTGLCVNCVHRDTCTLPKCEGGKVHCEEYECE